MRIISRAEWGARPPKWPLTQVPWSRRVGVAIHYTYGNKTDTPLDLQRYAQDTKGYADGHYNLLVDYRGNAYEGRGWAVSAAHSEGENVEWIGIAFIGDDGDVTPAAEATIAALVALAGTLAGRRLALAGHQELPGASTSCPGPRLMALVDRLRSSSNTGEHDMWCRYGDGIGDVPPSENVKALQGDLEDAGGNLAPHGGVDGKYGGGTARVMVDVLGAAVAGDGKTYGWAQRRALQRKLRAMATKGEKGDTGPRGPAGPTPTEVKLILPSIAVVGSVVATE